LKNRLRRNEADWIELAGKRGYCEECHECQGLNNRKSLKELINYELLREIQYDSYFN